MLDIKEYIDEDEHIVWSEKPNVIRAINKLEFTIPIIFGLVFIISGMNFMEVFYNGFHPEVFRFDMIVPILFIAMGIYIFLSSKSKYSNTTYYVTNKNVIIMRQGKKAEVRKRDIEELVKSNIEVIKNGQNQGHIIFEEDVYKLYKSGGAKRRKKIKEGFELLAINNVLDVYNTIISLK